MEDELVHMLAGMKSVLAQENCALVGGHTSEGQEPALGLAVTGLADPEKIFHKGPILQKVGYQIILTKPLGTGTLLAAHMRNLTKGGWMRETYDTMLQSNSPSAKLLSKYDCIACTDVTGFGLLGHLVEMIKYEREDENGVDVDGFSVIRKGHRVRLSLNQIPILSGAIECVQRDVVSSLFPQVSPFLKSVISLSNILVECQSTTIYSEYL